VSTPPGIHASLSFRNSWIWAGSPVKQRQLEMLCVRLVVFMGDFVRPEIYTGHKRSAEASPTGPTHGI
jgi:hypothetical protein